MDATEAKSLPIPEIPRIRNEWSPIKDGGEPLVTLECSPAGRLRHDARYAELGVAHALRECLCRRTVAGKLAAAAESLPEGMVLVVLDAYRPQAVQRQLFNRLYDRLVAEGATSNAAYREACHYVSDPNHAALPHVTGGAVDVTLARARGEGFWMGTAYDHFCEESATRHFEEMSAPSGRDMEARSNRRILYHAMAGQGFTNYGPEWWHFDYGDAFWSQASGELAIYGVLGR